MLREIAWTATACSTIALRLATFIYLRWISSHVLWPLIIYFWIAYIISFILMLYLDLEAVPEISEIEITDTVEVVSNGTDKVVIETETIDVKNPTPRRPVSWMETMYLGIPNSNVLLSIATVLINASMLIMTLDLTFRTYLFYPVDDLAFHRPVPLSPYSANILIRSPPEAPLPLHVYYKPARSQTWNPGPLAFDFLNTTDFTSVVTIEGLHPATPYQYAVLPPNVEMATANKSAFGKFETHPIRGTSGRWTFGSSSCIKTGLPYNPLTHPLRLQGLEHLEKDISKLKFFAFLGDFIYVDVPHRAPTTPEVYMMQYRQVYASPSIQDILPNIPFYHVGDDHDIINDYDQGPNTSLYKNASWAFNAYHRAPNPSPVHSDVNYFIMDYADTSFFFMDTRSYRSSNFAEDGPNKTMLGERQLRDLVEWAKKCERDRVVWKFIISSVPITNNWKGPDGTRDTWGGFMHERGIVLEALKDVSNVVVISGDRHEAAVTLLPGDVLEVSVSPLNQFYIPIRTYHSSETDKEIVYLPDGNQKYGLYTIDTTNPNQPILEVELKDRGETIWKHVFSGKKVGEKPHIDTGKSYLEKGWDWIEGVRGAWRQQHVT